MFTNLLKMQSFQELDFAKAEAEKDLKWFIMLTESKGLFAVIKSFTRYPQLNYL